MLEILKFPHPTLRKKSVPVEKITDSIRKLIQDMMETMYACGGIGLSAPQVGSLLRLFVMDTRPNQKQAERYEEVQKMEMTELEKKQAQPMVFLNPRIVSQEGQSSFREGCLSLPGYYEEVSRPSRISVCSLDEQGKKFVLDVDGLMAVCIQHEIDHLDGKLFIDHISPIKALRIKSRIKKLGYPRDFNSGTSKQQASGESKAGASGPEAATQADPHGGG